MIANSWPGQMRTVYGDHDRFVKTYFSAYPGKYFTGDGCRRDADGFYWITGRVDDVINVSGHRMGTAEVESALVAHPKVSEAAVVGYPHDIKGQGIYAYVTVMTGVEPTEELRKELVAWVRKEIGPIASPDLIQFAPGLPKTRSGKIMRRILRKIAENEYGALGDTSTLADPAVVGDLIDKRQNRGKALTRVGKDARGRPSLSITLNPGCVSGASVSSAPGHPRPCPGVRRERRTAAGVLNMAEMRYSWLKGPADSAIRDFERNLLVSLNRLKKAHAPEGRFGRASAFGPVRTRSKAPARIRSWSPG